MHMTVYDKCVNFEEATKVFVLPESLNFLYGELVAPTDVSCKILWKSNYISLSK